MKLFAAVLLLVACAAFVAAALMGATPPAARLNSVGLALVSAALLIEVAPSF